VPLAFLLVAAGGVVGGGQFRGVRAALVFGALPGCGVLHEHGDRLGRRGAGLGGVEFGGVPGGGVVGGLGAGVLELRCGGFVP
jgi:hypothetical protein